MKKVECLAQLINGDKRILYKGNDLSNITGLLVVDNEPYVYTIESITDNMITLIYPYQGNSNHTCDYETRYLSFLQD